MFIKSLRRAVQPRALGGLSRGYKGLSSGVINWTHECSSLADSDLETAKLEKY